MTIGRSCPGVLGRLVVIVCGFSVLIAGSLAYPGCGGDAGSTKVGSQPRHKPRGTTNGRLALEITPPGVIYKLPEALGRENWCVFLALSNQTDRDITVNDLRFETFAGTRQRSLISRAVFDELVVKPGTSVQMPMEFFRDHQDINVNRMRITIIHSAGETSRTSEAI